MSSDFVTNAIIGFGIPNVTAQNLAGLTAELMSLKYSRGDEYDADRRGMSYAHFAGYDPNGLVRFFAKLNKVEKRKGGADPEWMTNHPVTPSRIEKAKMIIEKSDYRYGQ